MTIYRGIWLGIYVLATLIATVVFGVAGELDGDLIGFPLPSYSILVIATIFVVVSYLVWMWPVFNILASIKVSPLIQSWKTADISHDQRIAGVFVLLVQIFYFAFNFMEGANVAGSRLHSDSPLRYFWILLAPDILFLVYYGIYRKSRFFAPNLIIYLLSNSMRGWLGTWLVVLFMEGAYRVREKRLSWKKAFVVLGIFGLFFPILVQLKWIIREQGANVFINGLEVFEGIFSFAINMNWLDAFSDAMRPTVMRFQHLANVVGIIGSSSELSAGLTNREFLYFFEEGLPQYTLEKVLGIAGVPDIHNMLLTYLTPEKLPVDTITNTHVGLVGWFWVTPELLPLYLFYVLLISWVGIWLAKKAGGGPVLMDMVWFAWLGWLLNGWFATYIAFLQALVILMSVRLFAETVISWRPASRSFLGNAPVVLEIRKGI